jgi:hypothetical protein
MDGDRERIAILRVLRVYHPVRGEEVQLELEALRSYPVANGKGTKRQMTRRTDGHAARMNLSPILVDELMGVLQGKPKGIT